MLTGIVVFSAIIILLNSRGAIKKLIQAFKKSGIKVEREDK